MKKMIACGEYYDFQVNWLEKRINILENFPIANEISTIAKMALAIELNKDK